MDSRNWLYPHLFDTYLTGKDFPGRNTARGMLKLDSGKREIVTGLQSTHARTVIYEDYYAAKPRWCRHMQRWIRNKVYSRKSDPRPLAPHGMEAQR